MWMPTSTDDLHAFLRTRRSIRRFRPEPIADSVIERILTTATYTPSAHNLQPWRFVVVGADRTSARKRLGQALTSAMRADMLSDGASESDIEQRAANSLRRIQEAPILILLCRDMTAVREHKREDEIMSIQSVANAATYLLLAVHAEGLGGNWLCWPLYAQEETRVALELPETWEPQGLFFIGWSAETPKTKLLKPLNSLIIHP
jgi:coenzyme F420-0:L-glutamate ligase/coenzyme F420-1:gamma-L-glutamate ligase